MIKVVKGAKVPFYSPKISIISVPRFRDDALLSHALDALKSGHYADALLAVEYVCRRYPSKNIPAILRAKIIETCLPELKTKAWYRAWNCDPENSMLQDAMLHTWKISGAITSIRDLAPAFLPGRCRNGTQERLIQLLAEIGMNHVGACWKSGEFIEGRLFSPAPDHVQAHRALLVVANETEQFEFQIPADGKLFKFIPPREHGVWSLSFNMHTRNHTDEPSSFKLMNGSPLVFAALPVTYSNGSAQPVVKIKTKNPVAIIIPVYRDQSLVKACIESVLASLPLNKTQTRLVIIDDSSPEPDLSTWLDELSKHGKITLLRNRHNLGFIETINRGLRTHADHDALILNADTLVHGDWIDRLKKSLYSASDIASVSPWTNNGEISSFPKMALATRSPTVSELAEIDQITTAMHDNGETEDVELPSCCGFAMLMRRSVIDQIGDLDGVGLIRGYGEEVDWCLRARTSGYRHLAATGVFIAHTGTVSFRFEKTLRVRQNREVLAARYPDCALEYARFINDDPLKVPRQLLQSALVRANSLWLKSAMSLLENYADITRHLPAPLASSCQRIAVWQHRLSNAHARKILTLARLIANQPAFNLRLLIIGEASEALWHTGVVDILPSVNKHETELLSDAALVGLGNCIALLSEDDQAPPIGIALTKISDTFEPDKWLKECLAV
jgi:GT2 family glycosyltransferase